MNKYTMSLFYFCSLLSVAGSCATPLMNMGSTDFVFVYSHGKKKPDIFSRKWLYDVARNNSDFIHYKKVRKNHEYFVKLLCTHIQKLETKLSDEKYRISLKKFALGLLIGTFGVLHVSGDCYNTYYALSKSTEDLNSFGYGIVGLRLAFSCGIGGCLCIFGYNFIRRAFQYKQGVMKRIARDKNILSKLKNVSG